MPDPISPAVSEPLASVAASGLPITNILAAIKVSRGGDQSTNAVDPYTTQLSPKEETKFQEWAKKNSVRMEPGWNEDYDMRGLWKANPEMKADPRGHWPDTYKKPNHPTFSVESIYAPPDAPRWVGFKLIDKNGRVLADETPEK